MRSGIWKFVWAFGFLMMPVSSIWAATSQDYYQSGVQNYKQGQYNQAVAFLQASVQLDPQNWQAYQVLGQAFYQAGDKTSALGAFQASLKIHPDNPSLRDFTDKLKAPPPGNAPGVQQGNPVEYSIPPGVLKKARKESKTPEGNKYDGEMFPGNPSNILDPDCMSGEQALGWTTLVLVIQENGTVSKVYAKKHGKTYDCLAPKFASAKLTPPPHAPFYKLFELNIKK